MFNGLNLYNVNSTDDPDSVYLLAFNKETDNFIGMIMIPNNKSEKMYLLIP